MQPLLAGLGEILWDVFPDGPRFGGAPANFACHAAALRARAMMVSAVGRDELGQRGIAALKERGVETQLVEQSQRPTGTVQVSLNAAGVATYEFAANAAWDHLSWSQGLEQLAERIDAVCFGTLGQRSEASRETIRRFVAATRRTALRIFDINLRAPFYDEHVILESLSLANVLKLNDDELPVVARACQFAGDETSLMRQLADRFELKLVALTRGPRGAVLFAGGRTSDQPGVATRVVDTVGAGDAFTATLAVGLLRGDDLDTVNRRACQVAAYVCSQPGATPPLPAEFC